MRKRIALLAALTALLLCACAGQAEPTTQETTPAHTYNQITMEIAKEIIENETGFILLDVRRQDEFDAGHIPGAICIPNEEIGTQEIPELPDKEQLILVYCRSGRRSKEASQKLADLGYLNVAEFGGILDWTGETVTED